jgi:hypothetical protein
MRVVPGLRRRLAVLGMAAAAASLLGGCATLPVAQQTPPLKVERVAITAAGHFVDLRYRVTDVDAVRAALTPKAVYRLTDEQTGRVMLVPTTAKLGALRQTQGLKAGHTYFMLFVNNGLRPGSVVTAEIGGFRFPHLTVQ